MMTGYHYTSLPNWKAIQKRGGIEPYEINHHPSISVELGRHPVGVWIWPERLKGAAHAGQLIFIASRHNSWDIVLLQCEFYTVLKHPNEEFTFKIKHNGDIGKLVYHNEVPCNITEEFIPISRIKLVATYDLVRLLK